MRDVPRDEAALRRKVDGRRWTMCRAHRIRRRSITRRLSRRLCGTLSRTRRMRTREMTKNSMSGLVHPARAHGNHDVHRTKQPKRKSKLKKRRLWNRNSNLARNQLYHKHRLRSKSASKSRRPHSPPKACSAPTHWNDTGPPTNRR